VVTGIGKSAIIGQKITATLNSTGTPAIFMHAADAIHGDLGMIQNDDIVLCLSKSGETAEIKVLVPLIKNLGNSIIAIVSNENAYLAQQANFVLHTPIEQEADPNNLAPTASTTAQMVIGDALATALLAVKGFTPSDFAKFHPGGTLGKQMYLRVSDLYPKNELPKVGLDTPLKQIILEISSKRLGMTAVLEDERLVGIITDGDLRRMLNQEAITELKAADIMTRSPKTIEKDALAVNALELMREQSITQLIVVNKENYVGVIHLHDLIREGIV
jgi:arabinose-5-phosphate isomerase